MKADTIAIMMEIIPAKTAPFENACILLITVPISIIIGTHFAKMLPHFRILVAKSEIVDSASVLLPSFNIVLSMKADALAISVGHPQLGQI